jgi:rRNA-processing protein FCF1
MGPVELVMVLEGAARAAAEPGVVDGVRVVHASGSGDEEIVAVVAAAAQADPGRPIVVVTADRGLRERVEGYGATTVGPRWLEHRLGDLEHRLGDG